MSDTEFKLITNPSKYKPHYDTVIKAEYTEATVKIILNNLISPHCKLGYIYQGIKHYEEQSDIRKGATIQLFAEIEEGYQIDYIFINSEKFLSGILGQDRIVEFDTIMYIQESLKEYFLNVSAGKNTSLSYRYNTGTEEVIKTLQAGEFDSVRVPYGTTVDVGYTVDYGYNGELRVADVKTLETHFVITDGDLWLSTYATKKVYEVHMLYLNNAKLEISYTDDNGIEHSYETGELADQTELTEYFYAEHGSELYISVTAAFGIIVTHIYINETEDLPNHSVYPLISNITVQAITEDRFQSVTVEPSELCNNVIIYRGKRYDDKSGTISVKYGEYIHFNMTPKDSFLHYIKAIKINTIEYPKLESYQVLEDISVDSVAGENVFPKATLIIQPMEFGTIKVFYIDREYIAKDTPLEVLENYLIKVWIEPNEGYKANKLIINTDGVDDEVQIDRPVIYKISGNIDIRGEVILK